MPTENRSSNTEMVSVKRELVEQAMQPCFEAGFGIPHDALRDVLAKPAQQHQCEPVALPARKAHKKGNSPMQNAKNSAWNACLDEIAKLGPLYTHADPAEVERLRKNHRKHAARLIDERGQLRAQLAEAQALLRDIELTMDAQEDSVSLGYDIELRMANMLRPFASADPSAPTHDPKLISIVHTPPAEYDEP
ncbi:hypothetical protein [Pseudomonas sp. KCJK9000]|uniref:hypothetical protein n=1 Tax=Pseudomonas sp. KCJK9000 TaxID=3344566 RepID=UPI0039059ED8